MTGLILFVIVVLAIFYYFLIKQDKKNLDNLKENYDEKEDRSKHKQEGRGTDCAEQNVVRQDQPSGHNLLPTTTADSNGEDCKSIRKPKGLLERFRKRTRKK